MTENPDEYISSLSWVKEGNYLGIGTSVGNVQVKIWYDIYSEQVAL